MLTEESGTHILIATGPKNYFGFCIHKKEMGIIESKGSSTDDFTVSTSSGVSDIIDNNEWHIFCFASDKGIESNNISVKVWIDGQCASDKPLALENLSNTYSYTILGAGGKHPAFNNWDGDMVEVINLKKYLCLTQMNWKKN